MITERDNTTRIFTYNSITDDFDLIHKSDFTHVENSCSDRQYGFVDVK